MAAFSDTNPATAFNPFGDGAHNNPATIEAIRLLQNDARSVEQYPEPPSLRTARCWICPGGPARLALGSEWRKEQFGLTLLGTPRRIRPNSQISLC